MVQKGIRVKHQRRHVVILGRKGSSVPCKRVIPPFNHGRVGKRSRRADEIARCAVQRRELHKEPILVPGLVDGLYGLFKGCGDELIVKGWEIHVQFCRVANVVDAYPERHERLVRVDNVLEDGLGVVEEFLSLVYQLDGPVVVKRQVLDGDISASKGKVPKLNIACLRVGETFFCAAIRNVFDPVWTAVCSAVDIFLLNTV